MPTETIAQRITLMRKRRNMTQKDLADKTGLTTSTISNYEAGRFTPNVANMKLLADALGTSMEFLAGQTDADSGAASRDEYSQITSKFDEMVITAWMKIEQDETLTHIQKQELFDKIEQLLSYVTMLFSDTVFSMTSLASRSYTYGYLAGSGQDDVLDIINKTREDIP